MNIIKDEAQKQKVLEKIAKLMAMTESSNPNEVEIATRMSKELMDKYDLDVSMVDQIQNKTATIDEKIFKVDRYLLPRWMNILAGSVGKFYECNVIVRGGNKVVFIGFDLDREVAGKVYAYLTEKMAIRANSYSQNFYGGRKVQARNQFLKGCLRRDRSQRQALNSWLSSQIRLLLTWKRISQTSKVVESTSSSQIWILKQESAMARQCSWLN